MSTSLENYCEQIEVLILRNRPEFAGFSVVRANEDQGAEIDRIVVSSEGRETEIFDEDGKSPIVIRIPVSIEIHLVTRSEEAFDSLISAIAKSQRQDAPASALALASLAFPKGAFIRDTNIGSKVNSPNTRKESRTFDFVITLV